MFATLTVAGSACRGQSVGRGRLPSFTQLHPALCSNVTPFKDVHIDTQVYGSAARNVPSLFNFDVNDFEWLSLCLRKGSGKSTLLKALSDKLDNDVQGAGAREATLAELRRREAELGISPDPAVDAYMEAEAIQGGPHNVATEYVNCMLGLDICADTPVGNELRGISGGQKKRVTTDEVLVGPKIVRFGDEISTGLDASTTFQGPAPSKNALPRVLFCGGMAVVAAGALLPGMAWASPTPPAAGLVGILRFEGLLRTISQLFNPSDSPAALLTLLYQSLPLSQAFASRVPGTLITAMYGVCTLGAWSTLNARKWSVWTALEREDDAPELAGLRDRGDAMLIVEGENTVILLAAATVVCGTGVVQIPELLNPAIIFSDPTWQAWGAGATVLALAADPFLSYNFSQRETNLLIKIAVRRREFQSKRKTE